MPERFNNIRLVPDGGGSPQRVTVEVGMEGFNILDGSRTLRKYPLHHISRWSNRGTSLILFTKSPVDIEDRTVTLQGDEHVIRSVLDMLTCSCMQMAELLQSGQVGADGTTNTAAANSLNALLKKSKKPTLLTADQVEFWHHPEKEGWMYSQGEHIKTWRKRWFILKQGFLFRFSDTNVSSGSKPRGIVDLSTVTDVTDGSSVTGRPNSVRLATATGGTCYLVDNETAQVEWISALETTVTRLVRTIAGVDDEEPAKAASLAEQLMRSYNAASGSSPTTTTSHRHRSASGGGSSRGHHHKPNGNGMIKVVNYEPSSHSQGDDPYHRQGSSARYGGGGGSSEYVTIDYGSVAGAHRLPESAAAAAPSHTMYGGGGSGGYSVGGGSGVYPTIGGTPPSSMQSGAMMMGGQQQHQQQQPSAMYNQQQPQTMYPQDTGYMQQQQQMPQQQYQPADVDYGAMQQQQHPVVQQQQQPMSLFDAATAPPAPPPAPTSPWQVHYTAEGRPYYYNSSTGITSWDPPTN